MVTPIHLRVQSVIHLKKKITYQKLRVKINGDNEKNVGSYTEAGVAREANTQGKKTLVENIYKVRRQMHFPPVLFHRIFTFVGL